MKLNVISIDYPEHGHIKFLRNVGTFKTYATRLEFQYLKHKNLMSCKKRTFWEESVKSQLQERRWHADIFSLVPETIWQRKMRIGTHFHYIRCTKFHFFFSQLHFVISCVTKVMQTTTPALIRLSSVLFFSPPPEANQSYTFSTIIKSFWW